MTLNARICRHIIRMRSGPAAEAQIREFAIELARVARRVWPEACGDLELLPNDVLSMEEGI
jgi:thymidylate synthase ThyX